MNKRGLRTVSDLLHYYPRAFEDRRAARNIGTLRADDIVSLKAQVVKVSSFNMGQSKRKIYDVLIRDSSGQIHCKFFRVPYRGYFERFSVNTEVRVIGKVTDYRGRLEFHHPDLRDLEGEEELHDDLIPLYVEIENINSSRILRLLRQILNELPIAAWPPEALPQVLRQELGLVTLQQALQSIHQPSAEQATLYHDLKSAAHRRLIFDEFFWLELFLAAKKSGLSKESGLPIPFAGNHIHKLMQSLPFALTQAQQRVLGEIRQDLAAPHPMNRLVQGDVGSGKTLVALAAAAHAAEHGFQSCLMVPTEILAEQHLKGAERYLAPLGLRVALLTGAVKPAQRKELLQQMSTGEIDLLIGTHALIEDWVQPQNLGLVIIDEQHRFGVAQRGLLKSKGVSPHFLLMTATPIPRTLAMTVYGDLDVSVIDEMPPGRSPIQTRVIFENKRPEALDFLYQQIQRGRQAYLIYPLVEESEKMDLKNAVDEFEKLKAHFPDLRIGLLHGRMKPDEKDQVMQQFRSGELQILVSTTVIEVGVDVANANLMIIEHAERFGLSQLHQLRGRVGRGQHKSFCVLIMGHAVSEEARERTRFMEQSSDGFKIAEFDLQMRGPGEFLGTRQSGLPGFRMANLVRDVAILQEARQAAFAILHKDPQLTKPEHAILRTQLLAAHGPVALAGIA